MNWLKQNPFVAGLAVVTLVLAGVAAFFLSQAMGDYSTASSDYLEAVKKLHALQNRSPYPSEENLKQTKALASQYQTTLSTLRAQLAEMQTPLNLEIKPQQFQDDLRTAVNQIAERAAANGVALPKDFYLGFGQYANNLPSEKAAPYLARELVIIKQVVNEFIDFKIKSLDGLERRLLPQEATAPVPAGHAAKGASTSSVLDRNPFEISFTAEQAKFRVAFNSLLNADQFLLVRAVDVANSNPEGPTVAQPDKTNGMPAAGNSANGNGGPETPPDLNVVLGRELVKVTMQVEIIDFAKPEEAKK